MGKQTNKQKLKVSTRSTFKCFLKAHFQDSIDAIYKYKYLNAMYDMKTFAFMSLKAVHPFSIMRAISMNMISKDGW